MSNVEQKYIFASRDLALELLGIKALLITSSDVLRKIVASDEEFTTEDANVLAKISKKISSTLKEKIATVEQYRLLNDIADGKLTVSATDGSEVCVTFDK